MVDTPPRRSERSSAANGGVHRNPPARQPSPATPAIIVTREERNIAVVRRFIDGAINGRDLAVVDETWVDDMTWHGGSLGTYESPFMGNPATGKHAECLGIGIYTVRGDRITEGWFVGGG